MLDGTEGLPAGWEVVRLGEILPPPRPKIAADAQSDLAYVGLENIPANGLQPSSFGRFADMRSAGSQFQAGDVLYGRLRPYLNKVWCADRTGAASAEFIVFPSNQVIDGRFLALLLHHSRFVTFASHAVSGDRPRIDISDMAPYAVALPPLAEQLRIVKAVDSLFTELDEAEAALARARASLAEYRASLLHAACTGQLTAAWRGSRPYPAEDGPALLRCILAERRAAWERAELTRLYARGKPAPVGEAWKARYPEPLLPDTESLSPLPDGWVWACLDGLITDGPQNGLYLPQTAYGAGVPIVRIDDFQDGWARKLDDLRKVNCDLDTRKTFALQEGDLVINRVNSLTHLGKSLLISSELADALFESNMMRIRFSKRVNGAYILAYLQSKAGRTNLIADAKWAVNQASINQGDVRKTLIPLPSRAEQDEVAAQVRICVAAAADLHQRIAARTIDLASLRQSILYAAFTGRLVPQDPADEPAAALLARLRDAPTAPRRARARTPAEAPV